MALDACPHAATCPMSVTMRDDAGARLSKHKERLTLAVRKPPAGRPAAFAPHAVFTSNARCLAPSNDCVVPRVPLCRLCLCASKCA